ncbi:ammecr1 protein [Chytriomyces cf. hyalinus JEL632]|nr:ammecr1 protein [Chytriomyces cf. hyalinus JEL632]
MSESSTPHLPLLCCICFSAIESSLVPSIPLPQTMLAEGGLKGAFPLFVTWKKNESLRGCIGSFSALPLSTGLRKYAEIAAFNDTRFNPISAKELPLLSCGVSLLVDFEAANDYVDWTVGVHGIWIEFESESGAVKTATYLPEVALEQEWDHAEAVDSLLRKGGYKGKITEIFRNKIKVTRYQSLKHTISFQEYVAWRDGQLRSI